MSFKSSENAWNLWITKYLQKIQIVIKQYDSKKNEIRPQSLNEAQCAIHHALVHVREENLKVLEKMSIHDLATGKFSNPVENWVIWTDLILVHEGNWNIDETSKQRFYMILPEVG